MSDNRPIGIFDSGLGGLTVAKEIHQLLPQESTMYIGDTARVPYGNRSPETVISFSRQLVNFLLGKSVKAIVVACATASSTALESLKQLVPSIPIMGVIAPTAKTIQNRYHSIGIIGTRATIKSQSFANQIQTLSNNHPDIRTIACPLFVPLIEEGITSGPILELVIQQYLKPFIENPPEALILGCTHYPLITHSLEILLPHTELVNVGQTTAQALKQTLADAQLSTQNSAPGSYQYYATDVTDNFSTLAAKFLESPVIINSATL